MYWILVILLSFQCFSQVSSENSFSFAILSDIHIGDAAGQTVIDLAESAVKKINSISTDRQLKLVFITGDLSNSALPSQYKEVKIILDKLNVPYFPVLGNHDVWIYNSSWEEAHPTGDALFANVFTDQLHDTFAYSNKTVWNPEQNISSWFQNWELRVGKMVFIALDWNSRHHAAYRLGYKGAMPTAELHNFTGGTFPWLQERLSAVPSNTKTIVLLQHQPFRAPPFVPEYIYAFSKEKKTAIGELLHSFPSLEEKYWGVFAGHFHIWYNGTAFNGWPKFKQWETAACKRIAAITLVTVEDDQIVDIQKMNGDLATTTTSTTGSSSSSFSTTSYNSKSGVIEMF